MEPRGLPPGVVGPVQGQLLVSVSNLVVTDVSLPKPHRKLFFRVKFWGDAEEGSCIPIDDDNTPSTATFSIRCDASTFLRYLADMGTVEIRLESAARPGYVVGFASVGVAELSPSKPVWDQFLLVGKRREQVGTVDVSVLVVVTPSATRESQKMNSLQRLKSTRAARSRSGSDVEVSSVLELFDEFDRGLARKRLRLIDVFRTCDRENCGVFDEASLEIMLQRLIDRSIPSHHQQLCWLMIDRMNNGAMTFASFSQGLRESKMACRHVATQTGSSFAVLHKVTKHVQELINHIQDAIALASRHGKLAISHMVLILRELVPTLNHKEERYLIASLIRRQPNGMVSFKDLQEVLGLIPEMSPEDMEEPKEISIEDDPDRGHARNDPMSEIQNTMAEPQVQVGSRPPVGQNDWTDQVHVLRNKTGPVVSPSSRMAIGSCGNGTESVIAPGATKCDMPSLEGGEGLSCVHDHAGIDPVDRLIDQAQRLLQKMSESCRGSLMLEQNSGGEVQAVLCTTRQQEPSLLESALAKISTKRRHEGALRGKESSRAFDSNSDANSSSLSDEPDVSVGAGDGCSDSSSCGRPDLVAEDALLKSLFFSKSARQGSTAEQGNEHGVRVASAPRKERSPRSHDPHAADAKTPPVEIKCTRAPASDLPPLRLVIDSIDCFEPVKLFLIVRCRSVAPTRVEVEPKMPAADVLIPQPEGLAAGIDLGTPLILLLEVRSKDTTNEQGNLVGIAKAPLAGGASGALAEGTYAIRDIINDRNAGKLCASVQWLAEANADAVPPELEQGADNWDPNRVPDVVDTMACVELESTKNIETEEPHKTGMELMPPLSDKNGVGELNLDEIQQPLVSKVGEHPIENLELAPRQEHESQWESSSDESRAVEPVDSVVCVEILRCTGLLAAVEEAQLWLGGGASLLGNARQLGPHPFVAVSLFPELETLDVIAPMIQTSFQAQCFCPVYHHKREIRVKLTAETVQALATQELTVEVWHHCSRAQAVAARLADGKSAHKGKKEKRHVFLGGGSAALCQLLAKPQGIRGWVPLKSRRGEPVGAVQLAVHFSSIKGHRCNTDPGTTKSPIEHAPQLVKFLEPQLRQAIMGPLHTPQINDQWIKIAVHIEEALFSSRHGTSRPPSGRYHAEYSLPGSQTKAATRSAQAAASGLNLSIGMGGKWRVDWHHSGQHWVKGDGRFVRAMLGFPLVVTVHRQAPCHSKNLDKEHPLEEIGSADIDLSILLKERMHGNDSHRRWLSGSYLLINGALKHLENARVKVRTLVDIMPQVNEIPQAHIWDISSKVLPVDLPSNESPSPRSPSVNANSINTGSDVEESTEREKLPVNDEQDCCSDNQIPREGKLEGAAMSAGDANVVQSGDAMKEVNDWPVMDARDLVVKKIAPTPPSVTVLHRTKCGEESGRQGELQPNQAQPSDVAQIDKIDAGGNGIDPLQDGDSQSVESEEGVIDAARKEPTVVDESEVWLQICVVGGLHLVLPPGHKGVFVSFQMKDGQQEARTQLTEAFPHSDGFAAQWDSRHEFVVSNAKDIQKISLHVWSRRLGNDEAHGTSAETPQELDIHIGCAVVDLSSLGALKEIAGWYNVFDSDSSLKGQVKVSVILDDGSAAIVPEPDWFGPEVGNRSMSALPHSSVGFEVRSGANPDMESLRRQLAELETMAANWTKSMEDRAETGARSDCRLLTLSDDENYVVCDGVASSSDSNSLGAACPVVITGAVSDGEETESHDIEPRQGITSFQFPEPFTYDDDWMFEITKGGQGMPSNVQSNDVPGAWRADGNAGKTSSQGDTTSGQSLHEGKPTEADNKSDDGCIIGNNQEATGSCNSGSEPVDNEITIVCVSEQDLRRPENKITEASFSNVLPPPLSTSPIQFSDGPPVPELLLRPSDPCSSVEALKKDDECDEGEGPAHEGYVGLGAAKLGSSTPSQNMGSDGQEGTNDSSGGKPSATSTKECQEHCQEELHSVVGEASSDDNCAPQALDIQADPSACDPIPSVGVPVVVAESYRKEEAHPQTSPSSTTQPPVALFLSNHHQSESALFSVPGLQGGGKASVQPGCVQPAVYGLAGLPCPPGEFSSGRASKTGSVPAPAPTSNRSHLTGMEATFPGSHQTHMFPAVDTSSLLEKYRVPRKPGWWKSLLSDEARGYFEPTSKLEGTQLDENEPFQLPQGVAAKFGGTNRSGSVLNTLHNVPNWRDLIGRGKSHLSGNGVGCTAEEQGDNHIGGLEVESRSEGSKRYMDQETERIAKIMASGWKL